MTDQGLVIVDAAGAEHGFPAGTDPLDAAAKVRALSTDAHIGPLPADRPVTLGDLQDDPMGAIQRIGGILKKDLRDPKTWMSAAAMYFGPKVFSRVVPIVARAAATTGTVARAAAPDLGKAALGYRAGKVIDAVQAGRAALQTPEATTTSPIESAPGGTAPPVDRPQSAPPPSPRPSESAATPFAPQRVLNELAIQGRRQGVTLSDQDYQVSLEAVRQGASPTEAVAALKALAPPKPHLSAAATSVYQALRTQGKSEAEALAIVQQQAALQGRLGTPSSETVRQAVKKRNETGRWDDK